MIYIGNGIYSEATPNEYLQHYGVIGMKWGVRKARQHERNLYRHNRYNGMSKADAKAQYRANMQGVKQYAKANKKTGAKVSDISKASYDRANSKIKDYDAVVRSQKRRKIAAGLIGGATAAAAGYGIYKATKAHKMDSESRARLNRAMDVGHKVHSAGIGDRLDGMLGMSKHASDYETDGWFKGAKKYERGDKRIDRAHKIYDGALHRYGKEQRKVWDQKESAAKGLTAAAIGAGALGGLAVMNKVKNKNHTKRKKDS